MDYKEKNILITGISSDIGKSILEYFLMCQAKVIVTYNNSKDESLKYIDEMNKKYNTYIDIQYLDIKDEKCIINLSNYVNDKYKKLDILINNASISLDNDIESKTKDEFMRVLEVNTVGTFLMMKYFDSIIDGYIFNMSSTDGIDTGNVYSIDYNVSKAGINMLTKTFSLYSKNKIISLCPNWVDTKSTRNMDKDYLESELKRVNQKELINPNVIPKVIDKCIKENIISGSIIRIEGEEDVRRID